MRVANAVDLNNRAHELVRHALAHAPAPRPARPAALRVTSVRGLPGTVYVAYTERGVCAVDLAPDEAAFVRHLRRRFGLPAARDPRPPRDLVRRLRAFFRSLGRYDGPVDLGLVGPFERRVLELLRAIPRGEVRTYRDIARALGYPGAARAVGQACARNPVPLIIPCHRVIRSDGRPGGYSLRGGVALKRRLLLREGVDLGGRPARGRAR
ncbi:MAG: MGMT family protein [Armatimonadota bacterium]|nr:MGMT family protein [Armatimonadota bacterium]MDR7401425.1 MGMT family protein [Armatimonadota bacterium]MDR7404601.1 MGMT family protein [Armatimonadota bacterium]MDR7437239.1 MGMT family protein [Armatimonadota bacterium]MDR7473039.1 MGMT family protein [Armatimonadota bacterium]